MLPFLVDLDAESILLGFIEVGKVFELARVLSNECSLLEQLEFGNQTMPIRKAFDLVFALSVFESQLHVKPLTSASNSS